MSRDEDVRALCLIRDCSWLSTLPGGPDAEEAARQLLSAHREHAHPHHERLVQKCPLIGCQWTLDTWTLPGEELIEDHRLLQREWSKHMAEDHPTVRGPGTTQVTARLFPYSTPSHDDRQLAVGSLQPLRDGGVPIFLAPQGDIGDVLGTLVGQVQELREEDGWAVVDGFVRDDLLTPQVKASLWQGDTLPVSFAVNDVIGVPADHPTRHITGASLREVRVDTTDITVWDGAGIRAVDPPNAAQTEPPAKGGNRSVAARPFTPGDMGAALASLDATLRPLRDAMEAWAQMLTPAIQALAEALAEHAKAVAMKPEPMRIVPGPGFAERIRQLSETVAGTRDWRYYVGVTTPPEGPEDWPRLPRDGKRAPTGCEVCEAPVDGRHPAGCPGA